VKEIMKFDKVFPDTATTKEIFQTSIIDFIKTALEGKNITVMAYGQTSSGKTHTMQGEFKNPGIIGKLKYH
jgi:hypothetical protein